MFERENSEVFVTQTVILVKIKERNQVFLFRFAILYQVSIAFCAILDAFFLRIWLI